MRISCGAGFMERSPAALIAGSLTPILMASGRARPEVMIRTRTALRAVNPNPHRGREMAEKRDVADVMATKLLHAVRPELDHSYAHTLLHFMASLIRPEFEKLEADNAALLEAIQKASAGEIDIHVLADNVRLGEHPGSARLAELTRLRKIKEYARHDPRCVAGGVLNKDWKGAEDLCSCGLSALEVET